MVVQGLWTDTTITFMSDFLIRQVTLYAGISIAEVLAYIH